MLKQTMSSEEPYKELLRTIRVFIQHYKAGQIFAIESDAPENFRALLLPLKDALAEQQAYLYPVRFSPPHEALPAQRDINLTRELRRKTDSSRFREIEFSTSYKQIVLFAYGFESLSSEQLDGFLQASNFNRDGLLRIPYPLVLFGTSDFYQQMATKAHDLYDWKGFSRYFSPGYALPKPNHTFPYEYLENVTLDPDFALLEEFHKLQRLIPGDRLSLHDIDKEPKTLWEYTQTHQKVLLTGPIGGGKTLQLLSTLTEQSESSLAAIKSGISTGDVVIPLYIPLDRYKGEQAKELIRQAIARYQTHTPPIEDMLKDYRFCFLLDGWTELPAQVPKERLIRAFLRYQGTRKHQLIISGRKDLCPESFLEFESFKHYKLALFDGEELEAFFKERCGGGQVRKLIQRIRQNKMLVTEVRAPLIARMIAQLWDQDKQLPSNLAELFRKFVTWRLERITEEGNIREHLMNQASMLAFHMYTHKMSEIDFGKAIELFESNRSLSIPVLNIPRLLMSAGILSYTEDDLIQPQSTQVWAFLAAYHAHQQNIDLFDSITSREDALHWLDVLAFCFGMNPDLDKLNDFSAKNAHLLGVVFHSILYAFGEPNNIFGKGLHLFGLYTLHTDPKKRLSLRKQIMNLPKGKEDPQELLLLAGWFMDLKEWSITDKFAKVVSENSDKSYKKEAYQLLVVSSFQQKEYEKSEHLLRKLMEQEPQEEKHRIFLAHTLSCQKKYAEIAPLLEDIPEEKQIAELPLLVMSWLEYKEPLEIFEEVLHLLYKYSATASVWHRVSEALYDFPQLCIPLVRRACRQEPTNEKYLRHLFFSQARLKNSAKTEEILSLYTERFGDTREYNEMLVSLSFMQRNWVKVIELTSENALEGGVCAAMWCHYKLKNKSQALSLASQKNTEAIETAEFQYNAMLVEFMWGKTKKGLLRLAHCTESETDCYFVLEGLRLLEEELTLHPNNSELRLAYACFLRKSQEEEKAQQERALLKKENNKINWKIADDIWNKIKVNRFCQKAKSLPPLEEIQKIARDYEQRFSEQQSESESQPTDL